MNRKVSGMESLPPRGLRLDRLLRELDIVQRSMAKKASATPGHV